MNTTAETSLVVKRHWEALTAGDVPALLRDYAEDAVLITGATGGVNGRTAIGDLLTYFVQSILPATSTRFELQTTYVEGRLGYIVWQAESATHRIAFSSDTFVIEGGLITLQTSAGSVEVKPASK